MGAVTGQLHSYKTSNAYKVQDFIYNVVKLFKHLIKNNDYKIGKLDYTYNKFIQTTNCDNYHTSNKTLLKLYSEEKITQGVKSNIANARFANSKLRDRDTQSVHCLIHNSKETQIIKNARNYRKILEKFEKTKIRTDIPGNFQDQ